MTIIKILVVCLISLLGVSAASASAGPLELFDENSIDGELLSGNNSSAIDSDFAEMMGAKIVGNPKEARPGEYEGVVFVQLRNYTEDGRSKLCTGTLISSVTVLTAGHCLYNLSSPYSKRDYTKYPEEIAIWTGVVIGNNLDPNDPRSGRIIADGVIAAKWHPKWQGGSQYNAVDMGLILLPPGIADKIKPYGVNRMPPAVREKGIIVGYGKTGSNKGIVKNMGATQLRGINERIISIGGESSICSGDSGGPLLVEADGQFKVAGVASRTTFDCSTRSGSTTRVDSYLPWIDLVLEEWEGIRAWIPKTEELRDRFNQEFKSLFGDISKTEYDTIFLP
ncbi:MAG: S1 family peptidase [Elusimicrobia bacterium]|nr:S1 family peptidase [Elusimicrobiota bacterium]